MFPIRKNKLPRYNASGFLTVLQGELLCFEVLNGDYNDHFADHVFENNIFYKPTLGFRAKVSSLKKSSINICLSLIMENSTVQLQLGGETNIFTLPDGEYCFGGYGDEVEYSEARV